jgi:hypothetical protein
VFERRPVYLNVKIEFFKNLFHEMLLLASDRKPGGNKTVLIALPIKDFKQYL